MRTASDQVDGMRARLRQLQTACRALVTAPALRPEDDFGSMALSFLTKQLDHTASVLALNRRHDLMLIVRSMLEGAVQLLWAFDPAASTSPSRAALWRHFVYVSNWQLLEEARRSGESVPAEVERQIEEGIRLYGPWYQRVDAEGNITYPSKWHQTDLRQMLEDIQISQLASNDSSQDSAGAYDHYFHDLYKKYAAWRHWDAHELRKGFDGSDAEIGYNLLSEEQTIALLGEAFHLLSTIADVVDGYFNLGHGPMLDSIYAELNLWVATYR